MTGRDRQKDRKYAAGIKAREEEVEKEDEREGGSNGDASKNPPC